MHKPFLTLLLSVALGGAAMALNPVTDNFDSPQLDTSVWFQYQLGNGKFQQKNGVLNFLAGKNSEEKFASIELQTSYPGYNEGWQMIVDVADLTKFKSETGCGFMIFNYADRNDYLFVDFYGEEGLSAGVYVNSKVPKKGHLNTGLGVKKGAVRVRYDPATKLLTFHISLTTADEGYMWKKVGTFSPTGTGGDIRGNWNMVEWDSFGIQLFGFSSGHKLAEGKVYLDNFRLSEF